MIYMMWKKEIENCMLFSARIKGGKDIPGFGNGKMHQKLRKQVFFSKAYRTDPKQADRPYPRERIFTIREVMNKWGVGYLYKDLINEMVSRTKNHDDEIAIVEWYGDDLTENHNEQRVLVWGMYGSSNGGCSVSGSIVFEYGKMTIFT